MYAELRCKSNFSFLEGGSHPEELVQRAYELGLRALALTDRNGVYGIPKAFWRAKDLPGLKLISGVDLQMEGGTSLTWLARDRKGYGLMCRMITAAHAGKEKGHAFLRQAELESFMGEAASTGLFVLPGEGVDLAHLKTLCEDRVYLPLSRFCDGFDDERTKRARRLADEHGLPLVATNDVLYHAKERKRLQDCFTSIRVGMPLDRAGFHLGPNAERHLKPPLEMRRLFADEPEALTNTLRIADACAFSPSELRYRYPSEWIPQGHTAQSYLSERVEAGATERYPTGVPEDVRAQLRHELHLIDQLGYADYFLTIYDIVQFARSQDILCQGRGSAANSAVCYCLGITAIDPVRTRLLFERFISAERREPPDIDVDFEHERREEVIQYIYRKYGRDRAAMVSAVITYRKRSALRELAKAFGIDVGTLSAKKVLKDFEELSKKSFVPGARETLEELSQEMKGFPRHISIHSGGFTLSADPIIEIVPVEPARMEGRTIIQWDKYDLDYLGLLKVDVLSLGMLTALRTSMDMVGLQLHTIPQEDSATYEMIQKADTVGTFQVESRAQMNMSGRLRPKTFYDLVIQVAIVRPGPNVGDMVHPYLRRRHGLEKEEYPHPALRDILGRTLGVPLFQEQLMKIAIELGDFTPGESDQLRRAIGAWRSSGSIQDIAEKLLARLREKGIPEEYALHLLEHMKGFAEYGFPESHAASFALLSYASCYMKRHYPAEFACALLNAWPMGFYAPHSIVDDVKRHGVHVRPVSPNHSAWDCEVRDGELRLGLRYVHGLSRDCAERIIAGRPYRDWSDFRARTSIRQDVLQRMAMGDAFREFGEDPRTTLWRILGEKHASTSAQLDLFATVPAEAPSTTFEKMTVFEAIKADYDAYRMSTRGHPMTPLRKTMRLPKLTTREAKNTPPKTFVKTAGLLLVRQRPPTAGGVCFAAIEDETGFLDMVIFKREFEKFESVFLHHCFLIVGGYIERDGHSASMIVKSIEPVWRDESSSTQGLVVEPTQYFW